MPYFIRIGEHAGPAGGVTSRGWFITRYGATVVVRWGPIGVSHVHGPRFWWHRAPMSKTYPCRSEGAARRRYKALKALKLVHAAAHHGYKPLPRGVRILVRRPRTVE